MLSNVLAVCAGVGLTLALLFVAVEFAALVGHLGRIADALAAQNAYYGIPRDPAAYVPPAPPETTDTGKDVP